MAVSPPYKYTRRYFDLPEILTSNPLPVVFLFQTPKKSREEICKKIEAGDGNPWPKDLARPPLGIVPWLRSYTPDTNAVFRLMEYVDYENVSVKRLIFIDEEGSRNGTCFIGHDLYGSTDERKHELARVEIGKAYQLICSAQPEKSWFPDILGKECEVPQPEVEAEEKLEDEVQQLEVESEKGREIVEQETNPEVPVICKLAPCCTHFIPSLIRPSSI